MQNIEIIPSTAEKQPSYLNGHGHENKNKRMS